MDDCSEKESGNVFDSTPYLKLMIDKDGRWFQNGNEIIHPEIYKYFCSLLEKDSDGNYRIRMGREVCAVRVEDAPFVVVSISTYPDKLNIHLNDESIEELDPSNLWIGSKDVPYLKIKNGAFHARFSRAAYYQLAEHIKSHDDTEFFLEINGAQYPIRRIDDDQPEL